MWLSQSLKINASVFYKMTGSTVFVFAAFQLVVWYFLLSDARDDLNRHLTRKEQVEKEWQHIQNQANKLKEATFINVSWANHRIESEKAVVPTQWLIEGSASVVEWQALLERVEKHIALGLQSIHWQRGLNGQWRGRLLFDIKTPKSNREYHNWLPTKLRSNPFTEKGWQVLSTMRVGESTSALLKYKQQPHWVREGSWLPSVGLMVDAVFFDRVILQTKDGSQIVLMIQEKKGVNDDIAN